MFEWILKRLSEDDPELLSPGKIVSNEPKALLYHTFWLIDGAFFSALITTGKISFIARTNYLDYKK